MCIRVGNSGNVHTRTQHVCQWYMCIHRHLTVGHRLMYHVHTCMYMSCPSARVRVTPGIEFQIMPSDVSHDAVTWKLREAAQPTRAAVGPSQPGPLAVSGRQRELREYMPLAHIAGGPGTERRPRDSLGNAGRERPDFGGGASR